MILKISSISAAIFFIFLPLLAFGQTNTAFPVAMTLRVADAIPEGGEIVAHDEVNESYVLSTAAREGQVYGVTAYRPALVFATGSGTVPVVTSGATQVRVTLSNGDIARGDLLVSSDIRGVAMHADISDDEVFAIALEDFRDVGDEIGIVIAEVGVEGARALQEKRRQIEKQNPISGTLTKDIKDGGGTVSFIRAGIATIIAVGGLFFILYSFRSTVAKGVVSIGRNPRARTSIMALAFGNIIFALVLCAVAIFVAIGVLILPL